MRRWLVVVVIIFSAVAIWWSVNNRQAIVEPQDNEIEYTLNSSALVSGLTTNLGYQLDIETAEVNLESFQVFACQHEHSFNSFVAEAWAGHGDAPQNPAAVLETDQLDLTAEINQHFMRSLNEPDYCTLHMVFGRDVATDGPSLELELIATKEGQTWPISATSSYAFGKNILFELSGEQAQSLELSLNPETAFDDIDFSKELSADDMARIVFENLIASTAINAN